MKIAYAIVFVREMPRAIAFYRDAVGLTERSTSPHWVEFETEGTTLALHLAEHLPPAPPPLVDPGANKRAPQELVFHADDPFEVRRTLLARGVRVAPPKLVHEAGPSTVGVSCLFEDPDGNLLSVYGLVSRSAFLEVHPEP